MAPSEGQDRGVAKNVYFLTIAVVAIIGFVAGTRQSEVYSSVASVFGVTISTDAIDTSSLQSTYQRLQENYDGTLDSDKLIEGANRGLVAAAGDDYTVFMSADEASQFDKDLSGNIGGGIGAEIGVRNDRKNANNDLKGLEISEDLKKGLEDDIQTMTDQHIKKIDEIFAKKEKEIMTV